MRLLPANHQPIDTAFADSVLAFNEIDCQAMTLQTSEQRRRGLEAQSLGVRLWRHCDGHAVALGDGHHLIKSFGDDTFKRIITLS